MNKLREFEALGDPIKLFERTDGRWTRVLGICLDGSYRFVEKSAFDDLLADHLALKAKLVEKDTELDQLRTRAEELVQALWPLLREYREALYLQSRDLPEDLRKIMRHSDVADRADQALASWRQFRTKE